MIPDPYTPDPVTGKVNDYINCQLIDLSVAVFHRFKILVRFSRIIDPRSGCLKLRILSVDKSLLIIKALSDI